MSKKSIQELKLTYNLEKHWYILVFRIISIIDKAFVPSVQQRIKSIIKDMKIKVVKPHQDGLLKFVLGSEMPTSRMLLQWLEETKISQSEIRAI